MNETAGLECVDVVDGLDDYLDGTLPPDLSLLVERHLRECPCCTQHLNFKFCMLEALRSRLRRIETPSHLRATIVLRLCLEAGVD